MRTVPLSDVATIERSGVRVENLDPAMLYLGLEHIERGGQIIGRDTVGGAKITSAKLYFTAHHVLFGKLRPNLGKVSRPWFGGVCSTDILPILPGSHVDRSYLAHFLGQPAMVAFAAARATGANLPRLSSSELARFEIPLPPIDEQRRIAAVLDHADALRAKRRQVLVHLDVLVRSAFLKMFGDPSVNPHGFVTAPLGELGDLDRGVSRHRPRNDPAWLGGPYPLIQTGDVARAGWSISEYSSTYSNIGLAQSRLWPAGTLCITIAANIADTSRLEFDACFPDSVVGFTSNAEVTTYVQVFLGFLKELLDRTASQSAQKNINLAVLRGLSVPVPPRDAVVAFHRTVMKLQLQRRIAEALMINMDSLTSSIASRAFRGEL